MRLFLFLAWTPGLLGAPGQDADQQQRAAELLAQAVKLHESGDLQGAISAYQEFLKTHPDSVPARSNLGVVYARLGRYAEAIEQYRQALAQDRANPALRFNLGLAYYKSAQLSKAAEELAQVLAAQPDNKNAAIVLADCHLQMDENKKVIEFLEPFQATHGDDPALLYLLGTALIRDNQLTRGQTLVDRILRQGDTAEAHILLGNAHLKGRDFEGAIREFERALELNPKLPVVHSDYGYALLATGDLNRAREAFRQELAINPNDFQSNFYLGVLLKQEQIFEESLGYLHRALQVRPGAPEVRFQLGSLYVANRQWTEAQSVLEQLVRDEPDFVEAQVSLATVYYRLKRKEDGDRQQAIIQRLNAEKQARAVAEGEAGKGPVYRGKTLHETIEAQKATKTPAQSAAEAQPPPVPTPGSKSESGAVSQTAPPPAASAPATEANATFDGIVQRAHAAREANSFAEATHLYREALAMKPAWAEGWWYLGTLHYGADLYVEARDAFRHVVTLEPKGGAAYALLGLCEYQLREYDRAMEHLEMAPTLGLGGNEQLLRVTRYRLALLQTRFEQYERALRLLFALAKTQGEDPTLIEALGIANLGVPFLPTELPADKRELVVKGGRAAYYLAVDRLDEAQREYQELLARYPDTPGVHYSYGVFLLNDDPDRALGEFRRELEVSRSHLRARLQIAFEHIRRAEYSAGLPFAEESARLNPKSFAAHNALGRILLEVGDVGRAVQELEESVRLAPDSPETRYALARAYARAGRKEEAARERAEFARLDKIRRGRVEEGPSVRNPVERPPI